MICLLIYDKLPRASGHRYVVAAMANDGLFLAKYRFDGQLEWSALDPSRRYADFAVASGENFYLIGAGPKEDYLLHVVLAR